MEGAEEGEDEAEDMEESLPIDQGTSRGAAHKRPARDATLPTSMQSH